MNGKHRLSICPEGLYYIVVLSFILGGAILREINLLFVLSGMMLGPLIYNLRAVTAALKRLTVKRRLPVGVCAGDLLVVEFEAATSRKAGSSAILVSDRIALDTDAAGHAEMLENGAGRAEVFFPVVEAGKPEVQSYQGRLMRRGRYRFGPFQVSTRFPLGLVRRSVRVDQIDTLIVCPRPGRLTPRWKQISQPAPQGAGGSRSRQGLVEGDFYGLRDWRSGDSRRWIHWRTSARRGALAVRQFEQPRSQDVAILVELWQPQHPTEAQRENVELAISFAATVAEEVCRRGGSQLAMGTAGRQIEWKHGAGSRALLTEIMEQLALAEADWRDQLPELLRQALPEIPPGTMTVLVSTRPADLHDTERFNAVWDDPGLRSALRKILCIDASSSALAEYFEAA